jgi:hypothetical protein
MQWPKEKKRGNGTHTDVQNTTETKNSKTYTTNVIGTVGRKLWRYQIYCFWLPPMVSLIFS